MTNIVFSQLLHDMPITVVDSLTGIYRISKLKAAGRLAHALVPGSINIYSEEEMLQ